MPQGPMVLDTPSRHKCFNFRSRSHCMCPFFKTPPRLPGSFDGPVENLVTIGHRIGINLYTPASQLSTQVKRRRMSSVFIHDQVGIGSSIGQVASSP